MTGFLLVFLLCGAFHLPKTDAKISDKRLCADQQCSEPISTVRTLLRYSAPEQGVLSFGANELLTVYSKSAGSNKNLWGVERHGVRGYVPSSYLREEKVFKKNLKFEVDTEFVGLGSKEVPSTVKPDKPERIVVDGTTIYGDDIDPSSVNEEVVPTALPFQKASIELEEKKENTLQTSEEEEEEKKSSDEKILEVEEEEDDDVFIEGEDDEEEDEDNEDEEENPQAEKPATFEENEIPKTEQEKTTDGINKEPTDSSTTKPDDNTESNNDNESPKPQSDSSAKTTSEEKSQIETAKKNVEQSSAEIPSEETKQSSDSSFLSGGLSGFFTFNNPEKTEEATKTETNEEIKEGSDMNKNHHEESSIVSPNDGSQIVEVSSAETLEESSTVSPEAPSEASPGVSPEGSPMDSSERSSVVPSEGASIVSSEGSSTVSSEGSPVMSSERGSIISSEGSSNVPSEGLPIVSSEGASIVSSQGSPVNSSSESTVSSEGSSTSSSDGLPVAASEGASVMSSEGPPIVSSEGSPIVASEGESVASFEGSSTISSDGSPVATSEGASIVPSEGSTFISSDGSPAVASQGASILSSDGSPVVTSEGASILSSEASSTISSDGSPIVPSPINTTDESSIVSPEGSPTIDGSSEGSPQPSPVVPSEGVYNNALNGSTTSEVSPDGSQAATFEGGPRINSPQDEGSIPPKEVPSASSQGSYFPPKEDPAAGSYFSSSVTKDGLPVVPPLHSDQTFPSSPPNPNNSPPQDVPSSPNLSEDLLHSIPSGYENNQPPMKFDYSDGGFYKPKTEALRSQDETNHNSEQQSTEKPCDSEELRSKPNEMESKSENLRDVDDEGFFDQFYNLFNAVEKVETAEEGYVENNNDVLISHTKKVSDATNTCSADPTGQFCTSDEKTPASENLEGDTFINFLDLQNLLYLLGVSGTTVVVFLWGYIIIDKMRKEGPLIAKINNLEKALLVTKKENQILSEKLQNDNASSGKESALSNEIIEELKTELEEANNARSVLEEQVQSLEKELENSTEVGLELNRMLSDVLSSQNGSETLMSNIEQLQNKLVEQQAIINTLNSSVSEKETANHELQLELEINTKKVVDLQTELDKMVVNLLKIEEEKESSQNKFETQIYELQSSLSTLRQSSGKEIDSLKQKIAESERKLQETQRNLELKINEYNLLRDNFGSMSGGNDVKSFLDANATKAELQQLQREKALLGEHLQQHQQMITGLEGQIEIMRKDLDGYRGKYEEADKEKLQVMTKLDVLNAYFKEREAELQKEIAKHESMWMEKQGEASSTVGRIKFMQEEIQNFKSQNESLKQEIISQEVELKGQISVLEKKAHENWVSARQAERKLEDVKQEAATLRNRLTLRERNMNEDKSQNRLQSPLESNGDHPLSPLHMPMESPASPPLLYGGRDHMTTSPPLPGLPPFLHPPPVVPFMPPPMVGMPPFMPPPPSMFPGDHRPPPLGRMSSPPLNSRYSPDSRYYDRNTPSPTDDEYYASSHRGYSPGPYNGSRDNRRDYGRNRSSMNKGGASSGSANSNDSLDKINRHNSKV